MLNEYIRQKETRGKALMASSHEMDRFKRSLMSSYASKLGERVVQYSLRSQLITIYYALTKMLNNFPSTRDNHFVFGEPYEKQKRANEALKAAESSSSTAGAAAAAAPDAAAAAAAANANETAADEQSQSLADDEFGEELKADARQFKKRPRKLISDDGQRVLNIWFIPHFTELLVVFKDSPHKSQQQQKTTTPNGANDSTATGGGGGAGAGTGAGGGRQTTKKKPERMSESATSEALRYCVRIMNALNDIVHFVYASVCMNWKTGGGDAQLVNSSSLDDELNELQLEMNKLSNPCDPVAVCELLESKRAIMLLQFDCAIRFAVRESFLSCGRVDTFKVECFIIQNKNTNIKQTK